MKLTDFIANFLVEKGFIYTFAFSGGASLHLIHSFEENTEMNVFYPLHEQAAAMAADGYSRSSTNLGIAIATSGPGATNLITGISSAFYDSIPVLYITGQVATFRMKKNLKVRQIGFQETNIVKMVKEITNYAVTITNKDAIRYELEKAIFFARSGRPGPVLIDIPDDIQRSDIEPALLKSYAQKKQVKKNYNNEEIENLVNYIQASKRPIIIPGWGVHLSNAYNELKLLIETLCIPYTPSWAMAHFSVKYTDLYVGTFGTHGTRCGNFAVQNADLIISIGSRLDTKATGSPPSSFARGAKKICIDIDLSELDKFEHYGLKIDLKINRDAKEVINNILDEIKKRTIKKFKPWLKQIKIWKTKYPICSKEYYKEITVNPYVFVKTLSEQLNEADLIFVDTGCSIAWLMQAFEFKKGQRMYHDFNNTAMGWAIPASIGACVGQQQRSIICVLGDGSLMINIQELAYIASNKLPIKIFLLNSHGHLMVQQTQDQWFNSKYFATTTIGGLPEVNISNIATAFNLNTTTITKNHELKDAIQKVITADGPAFCNINISQKHRVIPQVKYGKPNEDADPSLPVEELKSNMYIDLLIN